MNATVDVPSPLQSLDQYRQLRETFRLACPVSFNFGADVVDRWALRRPDHPAMRWVSSVRRTRLFTMTRRSACTRQIFWISCSGTARP